MEEEGEDAATLRRMLFARVAEARLKHPPAPSIGGASTPPDYSDAPRAERSNQPTPAYEPAPLTSPARTPITVHIHGGEINVRCAEPEGY